ncbi:DUF2975 domain-containing protein [Clostridium sp.]|uniref:DUF2975 domain-containing protein n=1 Tax=Clostridium sp. TaxID=1506 RepID=UPI003217D50E
MKKSLNYRILNFLVFLGLFITILMLFATPLITTAFLKSRFSLLDTNLVIKISICIYLCAVPYMIAIFNLKKICKLVTENNAFSLNIVNYLKVISFCSFSEIIIFIISATYLKHSTVFLKNALLFGPIFIVTFIGLTIGFLFLVLSQLFKIFIEIKDENDKTI